VIRLAHDYSEELASGRGNRFEPEGNERGGIVHDEEQVS
jgi:hypothetical protein